MAKGLWPQLFGSFGVRKHMQAIALEPDAELMLRAKAGDPASFETLVERQRGPVINFLYRMVGSQAVAEELAQEVFLRVYRARVSYQPSAKFATWLFRIAAHVALNYLRDRKNDNRVMSLECAGWASGELQVADQRLTAEQEMIRRARLARVRQAIAALPAKQRAAVVMHKYHGMEYSQIAAALDCSESAVKSLLFRAYERLRTLLADCV